MPALVQLLLSTLLFSCAGPVASFQQASSLSQGIKGNIVVLEGNLMPGLTRKNNTAVSSVAKSITPREIYVYELTNLRQVKRNGTFYTNIQTKLVAKVVSTSTGNFQVALPPGKYSLFSKEPDGFFANLFDGESNIFPVEVKAQKVTPVEFKIDYNAVY
ncbi:hypothetical protein [Adhaeribacter aquaticus]|uniref:hypothetical protein n=1 Tax=Adhaeribacter aquaticus TaxID=299567 RepID=UPI00047C4FF8|nr:hypothetical protein [Adhaeribacter aquaticus]